MPKTLAGAPAACFSLVKMSQDAQQNTAPQQPPAAPQPAPALAVNAKKDSTNEVPMIDLSDTINFVATIHEKGLETIPIADVAKSMGYTNPSSTPFYRRMSAARHFGLLISAKAELTARARDYFKPVSEDTRAKALYDAVMSVPAYAEEVQRLNGKRINTQFIANSFARAFNITDGCATTCAKIFESSLRTSGILQADGTVHDAPTPPAAPAAKPTEDPLKASALAERTPENNKTHTLPLSRDGLRVISVTAPLDLTQREIERIKKWMEVTLLIEVEEDPSL